MSLAPRRIDGAKAASIIPSSTVVPRRLPGDLALVFDSLALATDAVEVADALAKNVDLTAEAAAAAVNSAPSLARADVANKFASILSGAAKAQLVASVPGLSPRAPSKGGGFEYF